MPWRFNTSAAGRRAPSTMKSPSPISASVMCANGARSPDAPTLPWLGTKGTRPALCTASKVSMTTGRTPECPRARLAALVASINRSTGAGSGSPTPTLWLRIRLSCSVARSASLMRVLASLPKPVFTPYTGASPSAARRTTAALARMSGRA